MIIDIITATLFIIYFVRGWQKGVIIAVFSLLGVVAGILCALKLSSVFAGYLFQKGWVTSGWAQVIAYMLLFIGVIWLVRMGAKLVQRALEAMMLGLFNRIAGGILYLFLAAIVLSSCLWIANQVHAISPETITSSKTYCYIAPVAPWVFGKIGLLLPFAKNVLADLQHFFEGVNNHLAQHVGTH